MWGRDIKAKKSRTDKKFGCEEKGSGGGGRGRQLNFCLFLVLFLEDEEISLMRWGKLANRDRGNYDTRFRNDMRTWNQGVVGLTLGRGTLSSEAEGRMDSDLLRQEVEEVHIWWYPTPSIFWAQSKRTNMLTYLSLNISKLYIKPKNQLNMFNNRIYMFNG